MGIDSPDSRLLLVSPKRSTRVLHYLTLMKTLLLSVVSGSAIYICHELMNRPEGKANEILNTFK